MTEQIEISQRDAMLDLYPEVEKAARRAASVWRGSVVFEDLVQDIGVRLLNDKQAIKIWELTPAGRAKGLGIVARQIASEQRESYSVFSGQFNYTTKEVRSQLNGRALSRDSDYEMTSNYTDIQEGEPVASSSIEINMDNVDLRSAFPRLTQRHQQILLGEFTGDGWKGDSKDITEAIDALTRLMNRNFRNRAAIHDGPGSRRAMSNATARRQSQRNY